MEHQDRQVHLEVVGHLELQAQVEHLVRRGLEEHQAHQDQVVHRVARDLADLQVQEGHLELRVVQDHQE